MKGSILYYKQKLLQHFVRRKDCMVSGLGVNTTLMKCVITLESIWESVEKITDADHSNLS